MLSSMRGISSIPIVHSIKNRQRWTFGGLFPEAYCLENKGESANNQTECLVQGDERTTFEAVVRFLHLTERIVGVIDPPLTAWPRETEPPFRPVQTLRVGERMWHSWQEAEAREVSLGTATIGELLTRPQFVPSHFRAAGVGSRCKMKVGDRGVLVRATMGRAGRIEVWAIEAAAGLYRVTLRVVKLTPLLE